MAMGVSEPPLKHKVVRLISAYILHYMRPTFHVKYTPTLTKNIFENLVADW